MAVHTNRISIDTWAVIVAFTVAFLVVAAKVRIPW